MSTQQPKAKIGTPTIIGLSATPHIKVHQQKALTFQGGVKNLRRAKRAPIAPSSRDMPTEAMKQLPQILASA
jgi:hypothetical protein